MSPREKRTRGDGDSQAPSPSGPPTERELIAMVPGESALRATADGVKSMAGVDVSAISAVLVDEDIVFEPLFGDSENEVQAKARMLTARSPVPIPELSVYYRVRADDERLDMLAERLHDTAGVEAAYVKPGTQPAVAPTLSPQAIAATPATGDFTSRQGYLDAPPAGINAVWASGESGGNGSGTQIIDIEGAWQLAHEDLLQHFGGIVAGTATTDLAWRNHGTAVVGEVGADRNGLGVVGIAPDADVRAASIFGGTGSANAIRQAADHLNTGDIILIELHRPGPRFDFQSRDDQRGYIAIEWFPDDLDAIRYAIARGVIVVEAAGNGAEDLNDALYDTRPAGFPTSWRNPFNVGNSGSGAVVVGAGAPPSGTHGRDHGPDRSRLDFSNFGGRVDAQGWGREVTTAGGRSYSAGDLQGGTDETVWYTDTFSGTSSASPVVVGAVASIQGILRARGRPLLSPVRAAEVLRATGSPQQDAPGRPSTQRIGNRPDIEAAIAFLAPAVLSVGVATQYWDECVSYPPGSTASLWLYVDNGWRSLDNPDRTSRDLVQRSFLGTGSTVRVWYQDTVIVGLVVDGT